MPDSAKQRRAGFAISTRARLRGRVAAYAPIPVNPVSRLFGAVRLWDPHTPKPPGGVCPMPFSGWPIWEITIFPVFW